jgi:hypothetical protein
VLVGVQKLRMQIEMWRVKSVHKVSGGDGSCIGNWTRGHSHYLLAKNVPTFCLCPETLSGAEFKTNELELEMWLSDRKLA